MNYIQTGEIVSTHGIRGEVKIYPWADYPEFLEEFNVFYIQKNKMHYEEMTATSVKVHKNVVLAKFEGIETVEMARNLIGKIVCIDKEEIELPENRYFIEDLLGCSIVDDARDEEIAKLIDIKNLGASDIYYIKDANGKEYMFPAVDEFIVSTDIENKVIRIKVIEGLLCEN